MHVRREAPLAGGAGRDFVDDHGLHVPERLPYDCASAAIHNTRQIDQHIVQSLVHECVYRLRCFIHEVISFPLVVDPFSLSELSG